MRKRIRVTKKQRIILVAAGVMAVAGASWYAFSHVQSDTKTHEPADAEVTKDEPKQSQPAPEASELFAAVREKNAQLTRDLAKRGAPLNTQDEQGRTALMIATYNNDSETAKALIDNGADVNIRDNMQNNPFLYAGAEGYLDILRLTIRAGADPSLTNRFGGTALIPAGEHGHVEVIRELLENTDIDIDHVNNLGWTALLEAIVLNNGGPRQQQSIQLLIEHDANLNLADRNGVTPLQHARQRGYSAIVQQLERAGAR